MLAKIEFDAWLADRKIAIIDGALATELEFRGHDLNHALWSAKTLKDYPESIQSVHLDYYLAGADVGITASYQATPQGLFDHLGMSMREAKDLIRKSVQAAQDARKDAYQNGVEPSRRLLIAGSIGPYGAYLADGSEYRGDYVRTSEEFQTFHRPRIHALIDAGVDLLALETMPNLTEIEAVLALLRDEFPTAIAWLSCTVRDAHHISDGSSWKVVLDTVHNCKKQVIAVGINCVPIELATDTLKSINQCTALPLLCYPNSGETWDAETKSWRGTRPDEYLYQDEVDRESSSGHGHAAISRNIVPASEWAEAGARLIGGCCRTGPTFIRSLASSSPRNDVR